MNYTIGTCHAGPAETSINEVTKNFRSPKLILYFSPCEHFKEYTELLHARFPNAVCMGSTSIATFSRKGADFNELIAVGIESGIRCSAGVLHDIDKYPIKYAGNVQQCVNELGTSRNTVCFELTTGILCAEESVLSTLNSVLAEKNIPVFGGSAGDAGTMSGTMVALNGKIQERSAVFVLIHNEGGAIHFFRENIYKPIPGKTLLSTRVDIASRKVIEYDHMPALRAYAKALDVSESAATQLFDTHPTGRIIGDEIFITANRSAETDKSITYHARIYENSQVALLEPGDYRTINQATMEKIKNACPHPSFTLVCNCLARTLLFQGEGYLPEFTRVLEDTVGNFIGFSGYGEQLKQHNFNQTMVVCVFE